MSEGFNQNGNPLSPKSDSNQTVKQESYRGASRASTPRLESGSIAFEGDTVTARSAMPQSQTPSNRPKSTHSGPVGLALGGPSGNVEDLSAMSAKQSARSNSRPHSIAVSVKEGLVAPNTKAGSNAESCKDGLAALGSKESSVAPTAKSGLKAQSCKDGFAAPSSRASSDELAAPGSKASSVASNVIAGSKAQSCKEGSAAIDSKASSDEFTAPDSKALSVASNIIAGSKSQSCKDGSIAPSSKALKYFDEYSAGYGFKARMASDKNIEEDIRNTQAEKSEGVAGWLKMPLFGYAIANHLRRPLYYFSLDSMRTYLPTDSSYSGYPPFCMAFVDTNHYVVLHFKKVNRCIPAPHIDGWWLRKISSRNKNVWLQSLEKDLKLFQKLMPSASGGAIINVD
ncbi:hypothetical protein BY996DRAFT_8440306 [Phakopsora pachyrhizi]|nr:hypothetical protein BY996DRAFT_8440306 [Phakopsora pachyrhizi]